MRVNRSNLLQALNTVKPVITSNDFLHQDTHFIFTGDYVAAYDGYMGIKCRFETDFMCTVPFNEFYSILDRIECEEVIIEMAKNKICFEGINVKGELNVNIEIEDKFLLHHPDDWKHLPGDFIDAINFCLPSTSQNATKPILMYLNVQGDTMESTDNYRISQYRMKGSVADPLLIHANYGSCINKHLITKYNLDDSWIFFRTDDGVIFYCRKVEYQYPNLDSIIEQFVDGITIVFPSGIIDAINVSSILAGGSLDIESKIKVTIENNKLVCTGCNDVGKVDCMLDFNFSGNSFSFVINPVFFSAILKKSNTAIVGQDRIMFIGDNFKHLIALFS